MFCAFFWEGKKRDLSTTRFELEQADDSKKKSTEPPGSIKIGQFRDYPTDYRLLRYVYSPRS